MRIHSYLSSLLSIGLLATFTLLASCTVNQKIGHVNTQSVQIPDSLYPAPGQRIATHNDFTRRNYPAHIKQFKARPLEMHDIVFLGNSITQLGEDWGQRLQNPAIKNRGIAGDVTDGVLARLGEICYVQPTAVFLEIGINDLFNDTLSPERTARNIIKIATTIHKQSPKTRFYFESIFPTSKPKLVKRIQRTNELVLRQKPGKWFHVIDTHQLFADKNDLMIKGYSKDGVHPNEKGYQIWTAHLKKYIK